MKSTTTALSDATALLRSVKTRIAVVGASNNPAKYGNIIVKNLMAHGYQVFPVNLHEASIAGLPVYHSLAELPEPVDIVNVVTPPAVTRRILADAREAGLGLFWLQDGSFDQAVLDVASAAPFKTVYDACIMVVARQVLRP
jgi:predicted CoA-binding protein